MVADEYIEAVSRRLEAAGADLSSPQVAGGTVLVGYRSRFRWQWMATKLHLFTVVVPAANVTGADLTRFANEALDYATATKGRFRGLQTGVAVIAAFVADQADQSAVHVSSTELVRRFSAFAWPVVVDLSSGRTFSHQGAVMIGGFYASWMRDQIALAFPDPVG